MYFNPVVLHELYNRLKDSNKSKMFDNQTEAIALQTAPFGQRNCIFLQTTRLCNKKDLKKI